MSFEFQKIRKTVQRLILIVGLVLYISDLGLDFFVAIQYLKNNDVWWCGMTFVFIVVPSIIVNITAIVEVFKCWRLILAFLQFSIFVRYFEAICSPNTHAFLLALLRYLETITESAPQLCLQLYVMLRQWYFPWYTVVSSVFSLLSLAWSITTVEKETAIKAGRHFGWKVTVWFLIWQLFTLVSRVSAIVLFSYVFHYYVIVFLAAHWFFVAVTMCGIKLSSDGCDSSKKSLVFSCLAAYPSLFHSPTPVLLTKHPKVEMILVYILLLVENIIMVRLSLTIEMPDTPHIDGFKIFAILIFTAATIPSFICFIFCYSRMDFTSFSSPESYRTTQMVRRDYGHSNDAHEMTERYGTDPWYIT